MIKGFVKPDGSILASNMIVEGSNRTAAMMCYEMGLVIGVDENNQPILCKNGKQTPAYVSFNLVDGRIEPDQDQPEPKPAEVKNETSEGDESQTAEPNQPASESQKPAENNPGGGIPPKK